MNALSSEDIQEIAERTSEILNSEKPHTIEAHSDDHEWVKVKRESEEEWRTFRKKVLQSAAIWAVILVIGFVAVSLWKEIKFFINGG